MNMFGNIRCYFCLQNLKDFLMLPCGHNICSECFQNTKKIGLQLISIMCKCGLQTNLPKQKKHESPRSSFNSTTLNHTLSTLFPKTPQQPKNQQLILDEATYKISHPKSHSKNLKLISKSRQFLGNQLSNEIKFIQIKFDRYLNEAQRNFNKLMASIKGIFGKFKVEAKARCEQQIVEMKLNSIADISRSIDEQFRKRIGSPLINLTELLNKYSTNPTNLDSIIKQQQHNTVRIAKNKQRTKSNKKRKQGSYGHQKCKLSAGDLKQYESFGIQEKLVNNCHSMHRFMKKQEPTLKKTNKVIRYRN